MWKTEYLTFLACRNFYQGYFSCKSQSSLLVEGRRIKAVFSLARIVFENTVA
jgi:hypothetical protein